VHAHACIFRKNDIRSAHLQTLDYHPGKFHIDPSSSFWEHLRTKNGKIVQFYVPLKNFSLTWRRHHCRWRAAKFRPMLGTQGLWAGGDLYRSTPAVTWDLGFSGLIRRTAPFSCLLRHTIGMWKIYSNSDPHGKKKKQSKTNMFAHFVWGWSCVMVWSIMFFKRGSYAVLMEKRCKMAIKHRFLNMNVSSLHLIWRTKDTLLFKHFPHSEKSMFIGHFTPIFHWNCVGAMFNTHY
jgi:hypothetical protein